MHIKKSHKQFFWLFFIIGFFLSLLLFANEFFSHQLFYDELNKQSRICEEAGRECNFETLTLLNKELLHKNQKRMIELKQVVDSHIQSIISIFIIFIIFISIGLLPILWGLYQEIRSNLKLLR